MQFDGPPRSLIAEACKGYGKTTRKPWKTKFSQKKIQKVIPKLTVTYNKKKSFSMSVPL